MTTEVFLIICVLICFSPCFVALFSGLIYLHFQTKINQKLEQMLLCKLLNSGKMKK